MTNDASIFRERGSALVMVDVISPFEFPDGADLFDEALPAAEAIARVRDRAHQAGVPVIYANDNFGEWKRDFGELVRHVLDGDVRGEPIARLLEPADGDHHLLKPRHSAFHETPLQHLLGHLGVEHLVLCGFTTDYCVLFTAMDAYLREYALRIPSDCVAAVRPEYSEEALRYAGRALGADVRPSREDGIGDVRGAA